MIMPIKSKFENMLGDYLWALQRSLTTYQPSFPYRNALLEYDKAQQDKIEMLRAALQGMLEYAERGLIDADELCIAKTAIEATKGE